MEVCQGFDQRIHNTHREIDVDVFNEDENVLKTWMIPTFGVLEIFAFGSGVVPPSSSSSSNTLRNRACKLSNLQTQLNRKLEV